MKISKLKVYDLEESIIASGYPMRVNESEDIISEKDLKRAIVLANSEGGGHDQFLSTIIVNFDLECSNKMWVELERYKFITFTSSQSTMHMASKFDIKNQCVDYTDDRIIKVCEELKSNYLETKDKEDYLKLLYSLPSGFQLRARLSTNYRCLKNVYEQRKCHRLTEWRAFCKEIEKLPYFKELCINE